MANKLWVVLLRGVNVGGRNKLPMAELREALGSAGAQNVRTYIQSGNVILELSGSAKKVATLVEQVLLDHFALDVPVVVRSLEQLQAAQANNPYLANTTDLAQVHTFFLRERPAAAAVKGLDAHRSPPDQFVVHDAEVYVLFPNGSARSKLTTGWFDTQLATVSTARNAKTVAKLVSLCLP